MDTYLLFDLIVNFAVKMVRVTLPFSGFVTSFALMMWFFIDAEKERLSGFWIGLSATAGAIGPIGYFLLPIGLTWLTDIHVEFPSYYKWVHAAGLVVGVVAVFVWLRLVEPKLNKIFHRATKLSELERNRKTDIRDIKKFFPDIGKDYDPRKYIKDPHKAGVFIGLNENKQPIYVPYGVWRKSHVEVLGTTGAGKGVVSTDLLAQAVKAGEAVFVHDPKDDEWAAHVLRNECETAGLPFYLIDLRKDIPQIDLLAGMSSEQLEELFVAAFGLSEKGGDADHYRMADRRSARAMSQLIHNPCQSISEIALNPLVQHQAEGFIGRLEELAFVKALDAVGGLDLGTVVRDGGCVYVVGSTRMSRVINAQRLLLVRLIQLAETRDRVAGPVRPICVFLDELKYHISRPALEGLGTARDKGMHFILAHQSISDLKDCPADLDGDAVFGSVIENCAIRIAYRLRDPETAEWLASMTGEIQVDDETRKVERNAAMAELMKHERTIKQTARFYIDINMFLSLPDRVGVVFDGVNLAQFGHICPIPTEKRPLKIYQAPEHRSELAAKYRQERKEAQEIRAKERADMDLVKQVNLTEKIEKAKEKALKLNQSRGEDVPPITIKTDIASARIDMEDLPDVDI